MWTVAILQVEVRQWQIHEFIRQAALQSIDPITRANTTVRDFGPQPNKKRGKGKTKPLLRLSYNVQGRGCEPFGVTQHESPTRDKCFPVQPLDQIIIGHDLRIGGGGPSRYSSTNVAREPCQHPLKPALPWDPGDHRRACSSRAVANAGTSIFIP